MLSLEKGSKIISLLKTKYGDGKLDELDGLMVEYGNWWFNIRSSNTQPVVRLVVEAKTKDLLEEKVQELTTLING